MEIALISSVLDKASTNIKECIVEDFKFNETSEKFEDLDVYESKIGNANVKVYTVTSKLIQTDDLDKKINADIFIFISKHVAKDGRKSLTLHPIGNFGKADYGGKDKTLCHTHSIIFKSLYLRLNENSKDSDYELTVEATHHGPYIKKPVLFVEIGSSEEEWIEKEPGKIISKSIIQSISSIENPSRNKIEINEKNNSNISQKNNKETYFIIGGTHYNHLANKILLNTSDYIGHMCAKYNIENLNIELIKQAMSKSIPKSNFILLDWKGMGKEKQRILEIIEKNNIPYKRSDKIS